MESTSTPTPLRYRTEAVLWTPRDSHGPRRARVPVRIQAHVPAKLSTRDWRFSSAVTAAISDAEGEIRAAQQHADRIGVDTIAQQLLRSESMASSQMEGIAVPSHRSLAKALAGKRPRETAHAAMANIEAVKWAYKWATTTREPFSIATLQAIHERIAGADHWLAKHAGKIRAEQSWVGSDPYTPANADFIPPPPGLVHSLLDDLCAFLNRVDLPPAAQTAIAHVHFETIHPFPDGNGRVGRALIGSALSRGGLCRDVVPPISLVFAGRKDAYIEALTSFRLDQDDQWLLLFAESAYEAARASIKLADEIARLQDQWRDQADRPRSGSAAEQLITLLPANPVLDVALAAEITGRSLEAARLALNRLEKAGVVRPTTAAKSRRVWESVGVFALVDEMERQLSRGVRAAADTR